MSITPFTHPNRSSDRSKTGFQGVSGETCLQRSALTINDLELEARAGIEPAIEVLQTSALPLGYRAAQKEEKNRRSSGKVNGKFVFGNGKSESLSLLPLNQLTGCFGQMKRIGIFKAKTQLSELCREVNEKQAPYVIEKRGRAIALLTPVPKNMREDQPDILQALDDWEKVHGGDAGKQDFPEVWKERSLPKDHPDLS